jgi:hypothetical protein
MKGEQQSIMADTTEKKRKAAADNVYQNNWQPIMVTLLAGVHHHLPREEYQSRRS